ncbi:minor capsid protein [Rhodococcus maanshanensis]|uniref:minor capsid protein n=1 Tax=Rhodococcus maanshanensis TaxID=183556 RepID=UPI0022B45E5B|nr:minor capsid protein [Rhodococcus maanshanensis]MCZ4557984.1 minor capsid protein [Rhodococcus maanshanensis]
MTGHTRSQVADGLARYIAAAGLCRYSPTGVYPVDPLPAAVFGTFPDSPADAIGLRVYNESGDRDDANPDVYVQLRFRRAGKDPRPTDDFADAVKNLLHDRERFVLPGGIRVLLCRRVVTASTTPDASARYSRPDSYRLTLNAKATP